MGPPSEEVLRLHKLLKVAVAGLGLAVAMESLAGYYSPALTDMLTLSLGLLVLRGGMEQLNRCIFFFTLMAGTNLVYAVVLLSALLSSEFPGPKNFFSTECPAVTVRNHVYQCSWRTVVGNSAVLLAVTFEFLCTFAGYKIFASMRRSMMAGLNDSMLDGEGMMLPMYARQSAAAFPGMAAGGNDAGFLGGAAQGPAVPNLAASANSANPSGELPGVSRANFTPFSGQPHKLED